jgi:hypothetical protein
MPDLSHERIAMGAIEVFLVADSMPGRNICGNALRAPFGTSGSGHTSWLLDDALHALALAEKRLFGVQRENIG